MKPSNDKDLALIEDYLNGRLPAYQMQEMCTKMDNDPEFLAEVTFMQQLLQLKEKRKAFDLLNTFQEIHREKQQKRQRIILWPAAAIAAACIALLVYIKFSPGYHDNTTPVPDTLFAQTPGNHPTEPIRTDTPSVLPTTPDITTQIHEPVQKSNALPPVPGDTASKVQWNQYVNYDEGIQTLSNEAELGEIKALMDGGKRKEALPLLEKYLGSLSEEDEDFDLRLEAGKICLKETKNYEKAAFHFKKVAEGDVIPRYKAEARFYLACTYLAQGKNSDANKLLQAVSDQPLQPWKSQAARLLENL